MSFYISKDSLPVSLVRIPFNRPSLSLIALAIAAQLATPANAQQSIIEEVTVTAQKREQDVQDVSVAVSAFSGDAIQRMGFEEGLDITLQVPNMSYFAIFGEASSPSVSLRGISLVNFSDSWESPVAIYVDDVYRGNPAGSAIQLFDLQRVEVLRGPQGTLYGRNTTGGLVHYVSKKPTEELDAYAKGSFGSYASRILEGAVSGPIADRLQARVAVKVNQNDGWQTNVVNGEKLNDTNSLGYRAQLLFDKSDKTEFLFNVHGSRADQQSVGFAHMGYLQPNDLSRRCSLANIHDGLCSSRTFGAEDSANPGLTGASQVAGQYDPEHVASGASEGLATEIDTFGANLNFTTELGNTTFTSVTAYEELDKFLQDDGDGTEVIFFDEQYSAVAEQYSQEFRVAGTGASHKWVTGVYLYKDRRDLLTEAPTTADGSLHREHVDLATESYAVFGQFEYDLNRAWTILAGLRYTDEQREFAQVSGPSFYKPISAARELAEDAVTGRLGLDWRPTADTLLYANLSTGFKSGGFSGSYNASLAATLPVEGEDMNNFEVGYKQEFAGGRIRLNTAAFIYEVQGYQAQVFIDVNNEGSIITNAGDVIGKGIEVELNSAITQNFELIAGIGLLDSEFESEQEFKVATNIYQLDGNELPSAPGLSYNFVARYYIPFTSYGELALQADYAWQDEHFLQIENDPYSYQEGYGIANAKLSWQLPSKQITLAVFANNIANEEYFTYQNTLGDDWGYGVWGKPRTVGASIRWSL